MVGAFGGLVGFLKGRTRKGPALVADHGFTTGRIDLSSFEKVLSPSSIRIRRVGAFGWQAEDFSSLKARAKLVRSHTGKQFAFASMVRSD